MQMNNGKEHAVKNNFKSIEIAHTEELDCIAVRNFYVIKFLKNSKKKKKIVFLLL